MKRLKPGCPRGVALTLVALFAAVNTVLAGTTPQEVRLLDGTKIPPAKIERMVTRLMQAGRVTGLAIAVINGGEIVYAEGFGKRNVEQGLPLTASTVMSGASFTKSVFAYMVMQLVEEKTIDLDRPVEQYLDKPLPEYEEYKDLAGDERYHRITARMLLSHTSGFPNWRSFTDGRKLRIYFTPGSKYAYSGEGIQLLQLVVEGITKRPVGDLIQERVFDRFGMARTGMVWRAEFESDYAIGYDEQGKPLGHDKPTKAGSAGSMDTTIADFARFLRGVVRGEGITKATRDAMLDPQVRIVSKQQFPTLSSETTDDNGEIGLSYGLGWGLFWLPYGKAFFKEGHDDGWENHCVCYEAPKSCIVLMSNSSNGDGIFKAVLEKVIGDRFTPWYWENYIPYGSRGSKKK
jgi:CubicO group peptidase (beta-lactamase class C family)